MPSSYLTTADALEKAAILLESNGLFKGAYYDARQSVRRDRYAEDCRMCTMGAINTAVTGNPDATPAWEESHGRVHELYAAVEQFLGVRSLADWNDAEERTQEEVVAALKGAAAAERERAS